MKKLFVGLATLPLLVGVAMAEQPTLLSDAQMDTVTAGSIYGTTGMYAFGALGSRGEVFFHTNGSVTDIFPTPCGPNCLVSDFPSLDGQPAPSYASVTQYNVPM
jgi:hypothetical protein